MEWIDINDRLPIKERKVIIWLKKSSKYYKYGKWMEANYDHERDIWLFDATLMEISVDDISHWVVPDEPNKETPKE